MERITKFLPAYDKRNPDPKKDYGISHVRCIMVLRGKEGAVHFSFSTGMLLPKTIEEYIKDGRAKYELTSYGHYFLNKPMGYDVGYHARTPQFEGQTVVWPTKMRKTGTGPLDVAFDKIDDKPPVCEWLGVPCYCDGSALRAEKFMDVLIEEGSDAVWEMLEADYKDQFKKN